MNTQTINSDQKVLPKAILFDVDGTIYSLLKMRICIVLHICIHILMHPKDIKIVKIISTFRKEREKRAGQYFGDKESLESLQYQWAAEVLHIPADEVRTVIAMWMYTLPLRYMRYSAYSDVFAVLDILKQKNIKVAMVSDYPVKDKLKALGITVDTEVSALDADVNALKPCTRSYEKAIQVLDMKNSDCWIVGDRGDKDGAVAQSLGIPYFSSVRKLKPEITQK
jgi:FMN phosphatase YigB (HAD superfamily)